MAGKKISARQIDTYPATYTNPRHPWFKFKLNTTPLLIAPISESIYTDSDKGIIKIYKHRDGPLYFTYINNQWNFCQLGYCIAKDTEYHYFSSCRNEWDPTIAVANNLLLDILYIADY